MRYLTGALLIAASAASTRGRDTAMPASTMSLPCLPVSTVILPPEPESMLRDPRNGVVVIGVVAAALLIMITGLTGLAGVSASAGPPTTPTTMASTTAESINMLSSGLRLMALSPTGRQGCRDSPPIQRLGHRKFLFNLPYFTHSRIGWPLGTMYVPISAAFVVPTFFALWTTPLGTKITSPAFSVAGGL